MIPTIVSQTGIVVIAAAAVNPLIVTGYPNSTTAGAANSFTVTAKDSFGNIATGFIGIVTLTSTDAKAVFAPTPYTFTATDAGVHTFTGTLKTSGSQTITASDIADGLTGSESAILVNSAAAISLVVTGYPTPATAGVVQSVTVTAKDQFGNTATGYTGSIVLSSSDGQAVFPTATHTFNAGDAGTATFVATLETSGTQSITATDAADSFVGKETNITVAANTATSLIVSGYPTATAAGANNSFTVTAKDLFGNLATGYTGTIALTSSDGQAVFAGGTTYTFLAGDAGVHAFTNTTLATAGVQSITAADATNHLTGSENGIVVAAIAANHLVVTAYPTPTIAGVAHTFTVTARDFFGNIAPTYTGTVALSSTDPLSTFAPTPYTFTAADAGIHVFTGTFITSGTQTISAFDGSFLGTQSGIIVVASTATSLTVAGYVSPTTAGIAHNFTVTARDAFGNVATGYTGTLALTTGDVQASFASTPYTFTVADAGIHTFSATFKTAGTQTITAADATNSLSAVQGGIEVVAAAATTLSLNNSYPLATIAGATHNFTVTARDPFGNLASGYTGTISLSSSDGHAVLSLTNYTFTATDAGVHTFTADLKTAGTQSISVADVVDSLNAVENNIVVTPAARRVPLSSPVTRRQRLPARRTRSPSRPRTRLLTWSRRTLDRLT